MGAIARSAANNITTSGVFTSSAITNSSVTGITVLANASDGITFISSQTASSSASLSFTSGLTSTYKAYKFVFVDIHGSVGSTNFQFNLSTDSGSNYNVTKTSTFFASFHDETDSTAELSYRTSYDLAQSTAFQPLMEDFDVTQNDGSGTGTLTIFNPSSTTYVKHFISTCHNMRAGGGIFAFSNYSAGYANTTSAINAIQFKMSSGNIDDGKIYLYGIK